MNITFAKPPTYSVSVVLPDEIPYDAAIVAAGEEGFTIWEGEPLTCHKEADASNLRLFSRSLGNLKKYFKGMEKARLSDLRFNAMMNSVRGKKLDRSLFPDCVLDMECWKTEVFDELCELDGGRLSIRFSASRRDASTAFDVELMPYVRVEGDPRIVLTLGQDRLRVGDYLFVIEQMKVMDLPCFS